MSNVLEQALQCIVSHRRANVPLPDDFIATLNKYEIEAYTEEQWCDRIQLTPNDSPELIRILHWNHRAYLIENEK